MLPDLIEIVPPAAPRPVTVTLPGSKSLTNRALILAALADGPVTLTGALWSEDTEAMTECLRRLGFAVAVAPDANEPANRAITVGGLGGAIPNGGTESDPLELFVANAGTAARFLPPFLALGRGAWRLSGVPRMHERPQGALVQALRALGYRIDTSNGRLPAVVHGGGPRPGARASVSVDESSQFASALLLSARHGGWNISVTGADEDELPYVEMTRRLIADFPRAGGTVAIEPDASSASYFWGANMLLRGRGGPVAIAPEPRSGLQADEAFRDRVANGPFHATTSRRVDLADSIMTAIVLAPFGPAPQSFTDLGRLRVQECERVAALRTELTKCGARVEEAGDTLIVHPGPLRGARIATYDDHRVAMCFGMLGLAVPGMVIENPRCARKTFPNFFVKLASLGAEIRDATTGRVLAGEDLLA
jgi:3-phosphoshikimate 1-carboxyvinyltransferase